MLPSLGSQILGNPDTVITWQKRPIIIGIHGQSNSGEKADTDAMTDEALEVQFEAPYSNVLLKRRKAATPTDPLVWTTDTTGALAPRTDSTTENMGWELSFGRRLDEVLPGRVRIVKQWIGSSGMNDHWRTDSAYPTTGGDPNLHGSLVSWYEEAQTDFGGPIAAICSQRGESDALDATDAAAFEQEQTDEITALRAVFGAVPIVLGRLCANHAYTHKATVRTAQANVAAGVAGVTLIDTDDLSLQGDGDHYTADSYVTLGYRYADAVLAALNYSRSFFTSSVGAGTRDATFTFAGTGATPASYLWDFGDGNSSTSQNPMHSYAANGVYQVKCTVTSPNGHQHTATADVVAVVPTWTVDATSGKGRPQSTAEWQALIDAYSGPSPTAPLIGVEPPDAIPNTQITSGNMNDLGTAGITWTANATPLDEQSVAGWSALAVGTTDATANQRYRSLQTALPDIASERYLKLGYIAVTNNPAGARGVMGMGVAGAVEMRAVTSGGTTALARIVGGGQTWTSALEMGSGVRPYWLYCDPVGSVQALYDDRQKSAAAWGTAKAGEGSDYGATIGGSNPATMRLPYAAEWFNPTWVTDAKLRWLGIALGWSITGYGV